MNFEHNFRDYVSAMDGSKKDLPEHKFDEIYGNDFNCKYDGNAVSRHDMKTFHTNYFRLGSKATLLAFKEVDPTTVEFKLTITNDKSGLITIHNIAKLSGNKIISVQPVDAEDIVMTRVREVSEAVDKGIYSDKLAAAKSEENDAVTTAQ